MDLEVRDRGGEAMGYGLWVRVIKSKYGVVGEREKKWSRGSRRINGSK